MVTCSCRTASAKADSKFIASIHTWVVRARHHTILVDSCAGNGKHRPGLPRFHRLNTPFLDRLAAAGVEPEQVDFVLCTHLHVDHCGWNTRPLDGRWLPTFPNAKYVLSRAEHEHWSGSTGRDGFNAGVYRDSVLPVVEAEQAVIVDSDYAVADGLLLHTTPGHSPGQVAVRLLDEGAEEPFGGDVMHQPVQVVRPTWNSCFYLDADVARASRRWVFDHPAKRQAALFGALFAHSSAGHVTRHGDRFDWSFA